MTKTETETLRVKGNRLVNPPLCGHPAQQLRASEGGYLPDTYYCTDCGKPVVKRRETLGKILVIHHEPVVQDLLDTLLSQKGYDVVLADGGRKGLELFHRERPDVIVLDVNMPEMDGIAVLQLVRSLNPNHPVSILTGAVTPETEQQVRALCVIEIVNKEFPLELLGDALRRILALPTPTVSTPV
jgi:CheY-like chemotaxis protein